MNPRPLAPKASATSVERWATVRDQCTGISSLLSAADVGRDRCYTAATRTADLRSAHDRGVR